MRLSLTIGGVEITISGVDLTPRQIKDLTRFAASIALALPREDIIADPGPGNPVGFTAHLDLDPERNLTAADWYEED